MKKLLVLGVGNILMQDEGIGVHAINEFWKEKENWKDADVDFIDGGTFTQDMGYVKHPLPRISFTCLRHMKIFWYWILSGPTRHPAPFFVCKKTN